MAKHNNTPEKPKMAPEEALFQALSLCRKAGALTRRNIVCFSISNSMSSSGNVMQLAAEELDAQDLITVIDSANLSTGIGLLVIEAAILAQNNKTAAEISVAVESLKPYVRASFVVDTLTYLHRGGRCSAIAAMAGGLLKLHPQIIVEHGAMKPTKKYRGKMDSVILSYVKDINLHPRSDDRPV